MGKTPREDLAIHGGPKAMAAVTGRAEPKIGVAEFLSIAERFGFSAAAMERLRSAVGDDDLPDGGPNLARFMCPSPPATKGEAFEALARETFGVRHAIAVSSGTGALHAAMAAVGAGPGKEVICPAVGFMATSAAVAVTGATPVFCDVDESFTIDPSKIAALITPRTVAVAPTHQWGGVCDMGPIVEAARTGGLKVVEDCAQSPGARYRGRPVGSIGDVGCFSISAYKIIGGGEGGLVVTDDDRLADRARQLAECGGLWRPDRFARPRYDGELFAGTNYRLSELEAAVDCVQLSKLPGIVGRFHDAFCRVAGQLTGFAGIVPRRVVDRDGWIGYELRFYADSAEQAQRIAEALAAEGLGARARGPAAGADWHLYKDMFPVLLDPACASRPPGAGDCPVAEGLYDRSVVVGMNQWWSGADCDAAAAGINKVLGAFCEPDPAAAPWM